MTVADLSVIEAVVDVSETDVVQVHLGDAAEVEVDAIQNKKYRAIVSQISNSPKRQWSTWCAWVTIQHSAHVR